MCLIITNIFSPKNIYFRVPIHTLHFPLFSPSNPVSSRQALARFFCGLLIGSRVGIYAKWISTLQNKIADDVSRLKATNPSSNTLHYDFAKLKQDHNELKTCCFFHLSPNLLSMIWKILLTRSCPALSEVLQMKPPDLGKLSI